MLIVEDLENTEMHEGEYKAPIGLTTWRSMRCVPTTPRLLPAPLQGMPTQQLGVANMSQIMSMTA